MTPEERMEAVIEIISETVVRIILGKRGFKSGPDLSNEKTTYRYYSKPIDMKKLFPEKKRFARSGRIPFGCRAGGNQRVDENSEMVWIEKIKEMKTQGISLKKIARHLNEVDQTSQRAGRWSGTAVWRIINRM